MPRPDLDFLSTPDLIDALLDRMDCGVIVGEYPHEVAPDGVIFRWCGEPAEARGYAGFAADLLTDVMRLTLPDAKPPEEPEELEEA